MREGGKGEGDEVREKGEMGQGGGERKREWDRNRSLPGYRLLLSLQWRSARQSKRGPRGDRACLHHASRGSKVGEHHAKCLG